MPSSQPKDVLLVGLGAVGTIYAFLLQKSGLARVTAVARSNYRAVEKNGVHIKSLRYGEHKGWRPYRVLGSIQDAADRAYSHVVLVTKIIPEIQTNSQLLHPLLSSPYTDLYSQPVYVLMQNGMNIEVDLWNSVKSLGQGTPKIIGTSVYIGSKQLAQDVVEHSDFDRVSIGIHREEVNVLTNTSEEAAILAEFGNLLSAGGTQVTIVPEIHRAKYFKNAYNCTLGPICALSRYSMQGIFRKPSDADTPLAGHAKITDAQKAVADIPASFPEVAEYTVPWMYEVLDEVTRLGRKLFPDSDTPGIDPYLPMSVLGGTARMVVKPESNEKPSMLVDAELGRPMEIEVIVGSLVRAAKKVGEPIPRLETLYALTLITQEHAVYEYRKAHAAKSA